MAAATLQERLGALLEALEGWGYKGAIAERFPLWAPGLAREVKRADFVAFTHSEQRDISTSAILAQVVDVPDEVPSIWLPAAADIGAPAALIALPETLTLWRTALDTSEASALLTVPVTAPQSLVNRISNIDPGSVARTKRVRAQQSLFPLGLDVLNNTRQRTRTYLTEQVENCLSLLTGNYVDHKDVAAKLVIGALAILMIRDKERELATFANFRLPALIDAAQQRHPGYFDWINSLADDQMASLETVIGYLESDINFAAIEPPMVSDVYEQALVNKLVRREQGTFYTPPQLAHQMLSVIPFESLEPGCRSVLDPACGSGTLLLAAAARLIESQPEITESVSLHNYLTSHLMGYDSDSLASEITKLCLLMTAMPLRNSWRIETTDTLAKNLTARDKPSVIVSNPPWQYRRRGVDPDERANLFVSWMLSNLADDGYLACVVPLSWINKQHSRRARVSLLAQADLLEVWRLPANLFRTTSSTIAPAVIVAKKHGGSAYRTHLAIFKTVRDSDTQEFLETGRAGESYLVEPLSDGSRLAAGPLSRELRSLDGFVGLGEAAGVYTGWSQKSDRSTRSRDDASHLELSSIRDLRAFGAPLPDALRPVRYPEDYHHVRATDERVRAKKVIVVSKHFTTGNPWRVNVGYDPIGLAVRESFISIIPNGDWPCWSSLTDWDRQCAVMAALGSGLASCWIDENEPTRNISIRYIKAFPFPADGERISRLAQIGKLMVDAVASRVASDLAEAASRLEETVNDVYDLTDNSRMLIRERLAGSVSFEGVVRYPPMRSSSLNFDPDVEDLPSFGNVLEATEEWTPSLDIRGH